jgi:hypothetical protein
VGQASIIEMAIKDRAGSIWTEDFFNAFFLGFAIH